MSKHTVSTAEGHKTPPSRPSRAGRRRRPRHSNNQRHRRRAFQSDIVAIEHHQAACNARETTSFALDDLMNNPEAREVSDAEWDACDRARAAEDAAFDELLTRAPTTAAGLRAALAQFISFDDGRFSEKMRRFLATLAKSALFAA